jgi:methylated-DNA-[protein]-cysteine S-methyltransferase
MDRSVFNTPWGWMGLSFSARGVRMIVLPKSSRRAVEFALRRQAASLNGSTSVAEPLSRRTSRFPTLVNEAQAQLLSFMEGRRSTLDFPIDLSSGSSFQRRVWRAILRIPYGRVRSYKWVAARVGGHRYARAVGHALGANPAPIIVPCHRVVTHDGSLGGFSGGLQIKRKLLALEGTLTQLRG